jgi:hypothetical protein
MPKISGAHCCLPWESLGGMLGNAAAYQRTADSERFRVRSKEFPTPVRCFSFGTYVSMSPQTEELTRFKWKIS